MPEEQDRAIELPELVEVPEAEVVKEVEEEEEDEVEDLSDLTAASKEDILGKKDGNTAPDFSEDVEITEEDAEEMFGVDNEDLLGIGEAPEEPKPRTRLVRRVRKTNKRSPPPPTSVRGIR